MTRHLREVVPVDQVVRWEDVTAKYPEAYYKLQRGWFYGAFREDDEVFRASSLKRLIDALISREGTLPDVIS
jgi:hypothetical protein